MRRDSINPIHSRMNTNFNQTSSHHDLREIAAGDRCGVVVPLSKNNDRARNATRARLTYPPRSFSMTKIKKVLLTGKTHTTASSDDAARGGETLLDLRLTTPNDPDAVITFAAVVPHPTAEQLFAGAWS